MSARADNRVRNALVEGNKKRTVDTEAVRQSPRMSSITRKIHFYMMRRQLASIFWVMIATVLLCALAYVIWHELEVFQTLDIKYHRELRWDPQLRELFLYTSDTAGISTMELELYPFCLIFIIPAAVTGVFRLLGILFGWHGRSAHIRRILRPINDLALKADEISRLSFSEDKYQILEEAITHIDPSEMEGLHLGDSDLAGVEAAMNNLLRRMKESYSQQARFVNDASHELRTPIAIIEGYANMLDRWGTEDEKVLNESITAIKNESAHMKHLVEQLLFLARGDAGRTNLQLEEVSLRDMMQEIYEESLLIDEQHTYRYQTPEQPVLYQADSGLLKQAVRILVDNASKYTNQGDEIILSCGLEQGHPYMQVQDTGIGMAESDVIHMFDRFYRSDEVRRYKGTGLGLSISKWIIDKHKGHFEITSRSGIGTRIRIVLP